MGTAPTGNAPRSTLKLPAYRGYGPPDAFLAQVRLTNHTQSWSSAETDVCIALSLEGEALQILEDLLPHEQQDWAEIQSALPCCLGEGGTRENACEEFSRRQKRNREKRGAFTADLRRLSQRGSRQSAHAWERL